MLRDAQQQHFSTSSLLSDLLLSSSLVLLVLLRLPSSPGRFLSSQTRASRCHRLGSTSLRQSRRSGCSVLVACDCEPSLVAQRLSLYHLVSKVSWLTPELAALRVACKDPAGIAIGDLIDIVRQKGEAFNSEKQTQQGVATMCFAGVAEEDVDDESNKVCLWWGKDTCRWGPR